MFWKKKKTERAYTPKDTLIIIGNGFDIWQGNPTSYGQFQEYYLTHRDEIMKKLGIEKKVYQDNEGQKISISDVELIYGDPFEPGELSDQFWNTFEASLSRLEAERLNLFFGKDKKGLRKMKKSIRDATRIMQEAFGNWIGEIAIDHRDAGYSFGDNCLFINFNYTDTLQKRFNVKAENIYHIHGEAKDRDTIIFGHSDHPQLPEEGLYQFGGRFHGLQLLEEVLYETDKHVQDNIQTLCMFLAMHGAMPEEIKNIYVLGHSMGISDLGYFAFLADVGKVQDQGEPEAEEENEDFCPIEELHNRLQYTINHLGYQVDRKELNEEYVDAVARKYSKEQDERNQEFQKMFYKMIGKKSGLGQSKSVPESTPRTVDAQWHVSYFSPADKQWIEELLNKLGCRDFKLYPSIDECLIPFVTK